MDRFSASICNCIYSGVSGNFMIKRIVILLALLELVACESRDTKFGKQYNKVRVKYGSPILHDYLKLESTDGKFELWEIPQEIHDTIRAGFHAGKGFYIIRDSILQEDDIFRKRIDDSTFSFVAIVTYGNPTKNEFTNIYHDSVDARQLKLSTSEYGERTKYRQYTKKEITIEQADSILSSWGINRSK